MSFVLFRPFLQSCMVLSSYCVPSPLCPFPVHLVPFHFLCFLPSWCLLSFIPSDHTSISSSPVPFFWHYFLYTFTKLLFLLIWFVCFSNTKSCKAPCWKCSVQITLPCLLSLFSCVLSSLHPCVLTFYYIFYFGHSFVSSLCLVFNLLSISEILCLII